MIEPVFLAVLAAALALDLLPFNTALSPLSTAFLEALVETPAFTALSTAAFALVAAAEAFLWSYVLAVQ